MRADEQPASVTELLQERAASESDRELYLFLTGNEEARRLSYASADSRARAVAGALRTVGLEVGDRVLLLYPPGLEFVDAFFGCLYAGLIAVPCGLPKPKRPIDRLERIAGNCTPAASTWTACRSRCGRC